MKIRMLDNIDVDMEKPSLNETWPKYLRRYDELSVDRIEDLNSGIVNLVLDNGDVLLEIPVNMFSVVGTENSVKETRKLLE